MVYTGKLMYVYFGHSTTIGGGDPSTQKHIGFNPLKAVPTPADELQEKTLAEYLANGQVPQVIVDELLETGKITLTGYYRDPLMLLCAFSHKTYPSSWTGSSDAINANFSESDHIDYIWMQIHIQDQNSTNHLDYFFDGGVITDYKWIIEAGKAVMEEYTIEFTELPVNSTTAVDIDAGFDDGSFDRAGVDGGWSMWNGRYTASTCAHSKDATILFNGSAISDLNMKKCTIGMRLTKKFEPITSQKTMAVIYDQTHEYYMDCEGLLANEGSHAGVLLNYPSKTVGTSKVSFGDEYMQITNTYLKNIEKMADVAENLQAQEVVFHYVGGALPVISYQWSGDEATDPTGHINGDGV